MFILHNDWFNPFHRHDNQYNPYYPWQWHRPPQNPYQQIGIDTLNKSTQFLTAADTNNDGVTTEELTAGLDKTKNDTQYDAIRQYLTSMRDNFSYADINNDKKLSPRESLGYITNQATNDQEPIGATANYVDLYNVYNTDGTPGITKDEYKAGYTRRHPNTTESDATRNARFDRLDLDKNGTISPEEFVLSQVNRDQRSNANISGDYLNHFLRDLLRNPLMRYLMSGLGLGGQGSSNSWDPWGQGDSNQWNPWNQGNQWDYHPWNQGNQWDHPINGDDVTFNHGWPWANNGSDSQSSTTDSQGLQS